MLFGVLNRVPCPELRGRRGEERPRGDAKPPTTRVNGGRQLFELMVGGARLKTKQVSRHALSKIAGLTTLHGQAELWVQHRIFMIVRSRGKAREEKHVFKSVPP